MSGKIRITTLIRIVLYFILFIELRGLAIFKLPWYLLGGAKIASVVGVLLTIYIYSNKLYARKLNAYDGGLKKYALLLLVTLAIHIPYGLIHNGATWSVLQTRVSYLAIFFLAFPIMLIFITDGGIEKFFKFVSIISLIWFIWLIVQGFAYSSTGRIISQYFIAYPDEVGIRNNMIRVPMRVLGHVAIIYNFDRFYNSEEKKRIVNLTIFVLGIIAMVYTEQVRGFQIAMVIAIFVMLAINNRSSLKKLVSIILIGVFCWIIIGTGYLDYFISSFDGGETVSVVARTAGMQRFWEAFLENPIMGLGLQSTGDSAYLHGVQYYFNDDGFIGLMAMLGVFAILLYGMMIFRFGKILYRTARSHQYEHLTFMTGLYVFLISTSVTLICYWNTTCLYCPLIWAVFEFYYHNGSRESEIN